MPKRVTPRIVCPEPDMDGGEKRLRFRIRMLLAERDMSKKDLHERIQELGVRISTSHFYRYMKPYHSPLRMDVLTAIAIALNVQPSELFDLVDTANHA